MARLEIEATTSTPEIILDPGAKTLQIKGICTPENPRLFFDPLFEAMELFQKNNDRILIEICLDYFNTGSSKCLLNLFYMISNNQQMKQNSEVNWVIEDSDPDIKESGLLFEEITGLKFNYPNNKSLL
ncbi:MAG: DUF1987 domain-containing protein [Bacteroidia bacterium]|jgi:hypothetical protein|nr:DUF1987 domain-containing protein [Bacteroidia bacterium]